MASFNGAATNGRGWWPTCMVVSASPPSLQWGRDLTDADGAPAKPRHTPDDLAASMGPRPNDADGAPAKPRHTPDDLAASMGPRPNGRGWRCHPRPGLLNGRNASMGPRPNGRGWKKLKQVEDGVYRASMGPRPNGRGWLSANGPSTQTTMGPRPNGRGWDTRRLNRDLTTRLQWGRDLTDADGTGFPAPRAIGLVCFNGAAT